MRLLHRPGPPQRPRVPLKEGHLGWVTGKKEPSPPTSPLGVLAVPSPGEEESSTPTLPSIVEDRITTQVAPGVAAVPLGEQTTAIPAFTIEPENRTEWEAASTPAGTYPMPGPWPSLPQTAGFNHSHVHFSFSIVGRGAGLGFEN